MIGCGGLRQRIGRTAMGNIGFDCINTTDRERKANGHRNFQQIEGLFSSLRVSLCSHDYGRVRHRVTSPCLRSDGYTPNQIFFVSEKCPYLTHVGAILRGIRPCIGQNWIKSLKILAGCPKKRESSGLTIMLSKIVRTIRRPTNPTPSLGL